MLIALNGRHVIIAIQLVYQASVHHNRDNEGQLNKQCLHPVLNRKYNIFDKVIIQDSDKIKKLFIIINKMNNENSTFMVVLPSNRTTSNSYSHVKSSVLKSTVRASNCSLPKATLPSTS